MTTDEEVVLRLLDGDLEVSSWVALLDLVVRGHRPASENRLIQSVTAHQYLTWFVNQTSQPALAKRSLLKAVDVFLLEWRVDEVTSYEVIVDIVDIVTAVRTIDGLRRVIYFVAWWRSRLDSEFLPRGGYKAYGELHRYCLMALANTLRGLENSELASPLMADFTNLLKSYVDSPTESTSAFACVYLMAHSQLDVLGNEADRLHARKIAKEDPDMLAREASAIALMLPAHERHRLTSQVAVICSDFIFDEFEEGMRNMPDEWTRETYG